MATPINLVHIIYDLGLGGAERQLFELVTRLPRERYNITVIRLKPTGEYAQRLEAAGIRVITVEKQDGFDRGLIRKLAGKLTELKPDIVHTWMRTANLWGRLAALRLKKRPVIIAAARNVYENMPLWRRLLVRWLGSQSDAVIGNSRAVVRWLKSLGIPQGNVHCIENGIEFSRFDDFFDRKTVFERDGLDPSVPLVLTVGRLSPQKDHKTLISAARQLIDRRLKVQFAIVGDGELREELQRQISNEVMGEWFHILKPRPNIEPLVACCDVFTLPSRHEGFPNVLAEALACGKPCVATRVSGSEDQIEDGIRGFLIEPGDVDALAGKLGTYLTSDKIAMQHGQAGKKYIRTNNSVEAMVEKYEKLYTLLLG